MAKRLFEKRVPRCWLGGPWVSNFNWLKVKKEDWHLVLDNLLLSWTLWSVAWLLHFPMTKQTNFPATCPRLLKGLLYSIGSVWLHLNCTFCTSQRVRFVSFKSFCEVIFWGLRPHLVSPSSCLLQDCEHISVTDGKIIELVLLGFRDWRYGPF